jgi:four helix bundle protein
MEPARKFEDLLVWQKAHELVLEAYRLTEAFPKHELYGLTSQLRRAAVSVPANIAEGFRKRGKRDKARFMNIAQASLEEFRYHFRLAKDLNYGHSPQIIKLADEVGKMLNAYERAILASNS